MLKSATCTACQRLRAQSDSSGARRTVADYQMDIELESQMITRIGTVAVYVTDQEAALRFWIDRVGFDLNGDRPMTDAERWLEADHRAATVRSCSTRRRSWKIGMSESQASCSSPTTWNALANASQRTV